MKISDFNEIINRRLGIVPKTLVSKGEEYSGKDDRLYDFKKIAQLADVSVDIAWRVLHAKHLVSVYKLMAGELAATDEMIDEKVGDKIVYSFLAEAIIREMENEEEEIRNEELGVRNEEERASSIYSSELVANAIRDFFTKNPVQAQKDEDKASGGIVSKPGEFNREWIFDDQQVNEALYGLKNDLKKQKDDDLHIDKSLHQLYSDLALYILNSEREFDLEKGTLTIKLNSAMSNEAHKCIEVIKYIKGL